MKHPDDDKTLDLLGPMKRGRGKPKGSVPAMTPAQRQKLRRDRLKESGAGFLTVELPNDVLAALEAFVKFKDLSKGEVVERALRRDVMRKR